jgi:hypothetical protein
VVAARPDGLFDAMVPDGGRLHVDTLEHGVWTGTQGLVLPLQYGST